MKRRFLALGGVLIVIGVLAFSLWHHTHRPAAAASPLFAVAPDAVTAISARWASGNRIALRRGKHGWFLSAPVRAPADATRVNAFIDALAEPVSQRYTAAAIPLTSAGLAPARLHLRIGGSLAEFGSRNPATGLRYVRRGARILAVNDTLLPRLAAGPWQFLSPRLLPPGTVPQAVQLNDGAPLDGPRLLAAWARARATSVGPADSSPSKPLARIRVHLAHHPQPLVFDVLSRQPELRLERASSKLVYTLSSAAASQLLPAPEHARAAGS